MNAWFIAVYIVWFLAEIILDRLMRTHHTSTHQSAMKPLLVIWITGIITIGFAVYFAYNFYFPISSNPMIPNMGLFIIVFGILLRLLIVHSMGRLFTANDPATQKHGLIKDGFFRHVRHPSFAASLVSFIGFGFSLNNYISFIIIAGTVLYVFMKRIETEEDFLVKEYGEEYIQYIKSTKAIIPFLI